MEAIEILACTSCGRTEDQWTMCRGCKDCGGKIFRQIRPTWFRILCWVYNNPRHVFELVKQDFREKFDEKRRKYCDSDSPSN